MFVVANSGWQSYFLLLLILVFWGVWPALRRISNDASSQAFSVVMVFSQYVTTCGICFFLGSITERGSSMFPEPSFAWAIVDDSGKTLSILLLLVGGCCIAYGDSAATMAIEHLGLALGGPMVFGISLSFGTAFDFVLQRKTRRAKPCCCLWLLYVSSGLSTLMRVVMNITWTRPKQHLYPYHTKHSRRTKKCRIESASP